MGRLIVTSLVTTVTKYSPLLPSAPHCYQQPPSPQNSSPKVKTEVTAAQLPSQQSKSHTHHGRVKSESAGGAVPARPSVPPAGQGRDCDRAGQGPAGWPQHYLPCVLAVSGLWSTASVRGHWVHLPSI